MMYRVVFEFRLTRRVDWSGDLAAFHEHVEMVSKRINGSSRIGDVRAISDIAASRLTLDFLIDAANEKIAEADATHVVSRAIRESGARCLGLAALASDPAQNRSALSELHTPIWQRQRVRIAGAA